MSLWVLPVPAGTPITQVFGQLEDEPPGDVGPGGHPGTDYGCPQGTPIVAASAGTVTYAGPAEGFGDHAVSIYHPADNVSTTYGHMMEHDVTVGQSIGAGYRIGLADTEGYATGPHLHFELRPGTAEFGAYPPNIDGDAWLHAHGAYGGAPTPTPGGFLVNMPTINVNGPLNLQDPNVRTLQALLGARGAWISTANGSHAVLTVATRWFQQQAGLPVDLIVGPSTWAALAEPLKGH